MSFPPQTPAQPPNPDAKLQQSPIFLGVLGELDINKDQLRRRQQLIGEIEDALSQRYQATNRLVAYVMRFGHPRSTVHSADVASLEMMLSSISGTEQLNVLLHSPGGDGTIVEKIVEMCRAHLSGNNKQLRVIVPNVAKSAATILALGADVILMGYCSELGPIDPQIQISVSGLVQWISALSFIEARDSLMEQIEFALKQNLPTIGLLQQLGGLNIPFTKEMEHITDFSKQTASRLLKKYMLKTVEPSAKRRDQRATKIVEKLLSKQLFPIHGHFIDGETAKRDLGLTVEVLDKDDDLWKKIWEYYVRCEVQMNVAVHPQMIKIKLFESRKESLTAQDTAT